MPVAKIGLEDYISRNPFAKTNKISLYDKHFVVEIMCKIRSSFKTFNPKQNAHNREIERNFKITFSHLFIKSVNLDANTYFNTQ